MTPYNIQQLINKFGNVSLQELFEICKMDRKYICPKCKGNGFTIEKINKYPKNLPDSGFVEDIHDVEVTCKVCDGIGYTTKEMIENKKIIIDGYIEKTKYKQKAIPNESYSFNT